MKIGREKWTWMRNNPLTLAQTRPSARTRLSDSTLQKILPGFESGVLARLLRIAPSLSTWTTTLAIVLLAVLSVGVLGQPTPITNSATANTTGSVLTVQGVVEIARAGTTNWISARVDAVLQTGDKVRTGDASRVTLRLPNQVVLRLTDHSSIEIRAPEASGGKTLLRMNSGGAYFFGRGKPGGVEIRTPMASGAIRGTEFLLNVDSLGAAEFVLLEGAMDVERESDRVTLQPGELARVEPSLPIRKTAALHVDQMIQWALYYPAVVNEQELALTDEERSFLGSSLTAYRAGNLIEARRTLPPVSKATESAGLRLYRATILLSCGAVESTKTLLSALSNEATNPLKAPTEALSLLLGVVNRTALAPVSSAQPYTNSASWWLAESYRFQAVAQLDAARAAARAAVKLSPGFGFAHARVAELEFSMGQTMRAQEALGTALELAPENVQAWTLRGFVLSAANKRALAMESFRRAIELDGTFANAWLGLGLCRIREGNADAGLEALQNAAALEPDRSVLRSYLGKAFDARHDPAHALAELEQAARLDPKDPTSFLYRAIVLFRNHSVNESIEDLERSIALNDNRRIYRSGLLLEQDRAVRGANLAGIYEANQMPKVGQIEASRAVTYDYANPSAHRFLADSYNSLRDPTRFNLRYETEWFNETLLADLLAPAGAGSLSQQVSQNEYARMFEVDRFGFDSATTVRSDRRFLQNASQFGQFGGTSYSLDLEYQYNEGNRPNNELSRIEWYSRLKQALSPSDSVFFLTKFQDYHAGDQYQYYNPSQPRTQFSYDEFQSPYVVAGYHHEWAPGIHTLALAGHFQSDQHFMDQAVGLPVLSRDASGQISRVRNAGFDFDHQSQFTFSTLELNQIAQLHKTTLVFGARSQDGEMENHDELRVTAGSAFAPLFRDPAVSDQIVQDFKRVAGYGYVTQEIWDNLFLTAGLTYDSLRYPSNHRSPPVSATELEQERLNPKAGVVWILNDTVSFRGMYSEFLGGVSFDESYRLEPVQLAGFGQAYRTIIPESVVGSVSGPRYHASGAGVDFKLPTHTYLGAEMQWLSSEVQSSSGAFELPLPIRTVELQRHLDYAEQNVSVYARQLLGREWSLGASYTLHRSDLTSTISDLAESIRGSLNTDQRATLQQISTGALYNHHSGWFARLDSNWFLQSNRGYSPDLPGDTFNQVDATLGFRLPRQRGSVSISVLNLGDTDYRLNPLNALTELPRERVVMGQLRLRF